MPTPCCSAERVMLDLRGTRLESLEVGALPVINSFIDRLGLEEIFTKHLPVPDVEGRQSLIAPAKVLLVLVRNILLSREPLYAVSDWLQGYVPEQLGLQPCQLASVNDDRTGRDLDRLFDAPAAALVTDIVLCAIAAFAIDVRQLHQDTTTITFSGRYDSAQDITFGYNKDHRPDLKQLVWSLVVSSDHAVPIHFHLYPGNTADDNVHQQTWLSLCQLVGSADFCYVGDCKLASTENMQFIDSRHGTFISVLPRSRSEASWMEDYLAEKQPPWREVRRQANPRKPKGEPVVYFGWESPQTSKEGYRVLWYRSSQKEEHDRQARKKRIAKARGRLEQLNKQTVKYDTIAKMRAAVRAVIEEMKVLEYLTAVVEEVCHTRREQIGPGRPGPDTLYRTVEERKPEVVVLDHEKGLEKVERMDGLFPLITNRKNDSLEEVLCKYKYQPFLEKRHEQLKSVLAVAPVFLKRPERASALLLLNFVALLIYALIERELRVKMKEAGHNHLRLYPECRASKRPTTDMMMESFLGLRRHRVFDDANRLVHTYHDSVSPVARTVLALLSIDSAPYGCH